MDVKRAGEGAEGISLIPKLFSLFRPYKFPVRTLGAIRQKYPRSGHILTKTAAAQGRFREFPCIFPC